MIPSTQLPSLHIAGPISIHPFGVLVVLGVYSGYLFIHREARKLGLLEDHTEGAIRSVLIPGFIGAHILHILFYQPERIHTEGWIILLKVWDGISSYGGFFGALVGFLIYGRLKLKQNTVLYADLLMQGLTIGETLGRLACTIAMDHPGNRTDFPLAFEFPGGPRHNLGFYEFLWLSFVMLPVMFWIRRKKLRVGYQTAVLCFLYAPARFFFDAMRATDTVHPDTRYLGMTPAQYASIALAIFGTQWLIRLILKDRKAAAATT